MSTSSSIRRSCLAFNNSGSIRPSITKYTSNVCIIAQQRYANQRAERPIPPPIPFVPDVPTFLTLIGRQLLQYASKIPSWEALFRMSPQQLRDAGIDNTKKRRYLMSSRERFRQGVYGIGGDFKYVQDGVGYLQVIEVDAKHQREPKQILAAALHNPDKQEIVVNVPQDSLEPTDPSDQVQKADFVDWLPQHNSIKGSYVDIIPGYHGRRAKVKVTEGLWEIKQGRKIDGGERRKEEVRAKRKAAANRTIRATSV